MVMAGVVLLLAFLCQGAGKLLPLIDIQPTLPFSHLPPARKEEAPSYSTNSETFGTAGGRSWVPRQGSEWRIIRGATSVAEGRERVYGPSRFRSVLSPGQASLFRFANVSPDRFAKGGGTLLLPSVPAINRTLSMFGLDIMDIRKLPSGQRRTAAQIIHNMLFLHRTDAVIDLDETKGGETYASNLKLSWFRGRGAKRFCRRYSRTSPTVTLQVQRYKDQLTVGTSGGVALLDQASVSTVEGLLVYPVDQVLLPCFVYDVRLPASPRRSVQGSQQELDQLMADAIAAVQVPGISLAILEKGEVTIAKGYGVRAVQAPEDMTADTLVMVGSNTKQMTSLLAAALVDKGMLAWDTFVRDIDGAMAVDDKALSKSMTLQDMFCMCTGLPPILPVAYLLPDAGVDLNPAAIRGYLAASHPTAGYKKQFIYNNGVYALGGFLAAAAASGSSTVDSGWPEYAEQLRQHVLGPLGMNRSTLLTLDAVRDTDYAQPHMPGLTANDQQIDLRFQHFAERLAPAGALWSSAVEMAAVVQMELAGGQLPSGSCGWTMENLLHRRGGQIQFRDQGVEFSYGLGLLTASYHGITFVAHEGTTLGYSSLVLFMPEAQTGVVLLANDAGKAQLVQSVLLQWLMTVWFDDHAFNAEALVAYFGGALVSAERKLSAALYQPSGVVLQGFIGRYHNEELGMLQIDLDDRGCNLSLGGYVSRLVGLSTGGPATVLLTESPPFPGLYMYRLENDLVLSWPEDQLGIREIIFARVHGNAQ